MEKRQFRTSLVVGVLIALTCSVLAYSKIQQLGNLGSHVQGNIGHEGIVAISGQLSQKKIQVNGDGRLSMGLTVHAKELPNSEVQPGAPVDLIIVLDRSGSMKGQKIQDARAAIVNIIGLMSSNDRLGLLSYSDRVITHSPLLPMTSINKNRVIAGVRNIRAGGGTNLGAGLQQSIHLLGQVRKNGNAKIMLISDGMANQGITDPMALGRMAARVINVEASVSIIGVGVEFNEYLMTHIADQGSGTYHFLEDAEGFAAIFQNEFSRTKVAAANNIEIHIPLEKGMVLVDAAGYPVENTNELGIFRPGSLLPGQSRTFFVTLRVPAEKEQEYELLEITVYYRYQGQSYSASLRESFRFACVKDQAKALASIDKKVWEKKVVQDDMNKLREDVARNISSGKKDAALSVIRIYKAEQEKVNSVVGSEVVADAIEDLDELKEEVSQTFKGTPSAVVRKQKTVSKSMQHKSYEGRRAIK